MNGLDQTKIKLSFDDYSAQAGSRKRLDRKSCSLAIPTKVAEGYSVAVKKSSFFGFLDLEPGATARLSLETFFAGEQGPVEVLEKEGSLNRPFILKQDIPQEELNWGPCGGDVTIRLNTSILVKANDSEAFASIEQTPKGGPGIKLVVKKCGEEEGDIVGDL